MTSELLDGMTRGTPEINSGIWGEIRPDTDTPQQTLKVKENIHENLKLKETLLMY